MVYSPPHPSSLTAVLLKSLRAMHLHPSASKRCSASRNTPNPFSCVLPPPPPPAPSVDGPMISTLFYHTQTKPTRNTTMPGSESGSNLSPPKPRESIEARRHFHADATEDISNSPSRPAHSGQDPHNDDTAVTGISRKPPSSSSFASGVPGLFFCACRCKLRFGIINVCRLFGQPVATI